MLKLQLGNLTKMKMTHQLANYTNQN